MLPAPPELDYAPRPDRRAARAAAMRRVVLVVVVATAMLVAYFGARRAWNAAQARARLAAIEQQCVAYQPSPDQVVYEEDVREPAIPPPQVSVAGGRYRSFRGSNPPMTTWWQADALADLRSELQTSAYETGSTVFLGPLTDRSGRRVIAAVEASRFGPQTGGGLVLTVWQFASAGMGQPLREVGRTDWWCDCSKLPPGSLRLFAGRVDPSDPGRFTFDFQVGGRRGTFEGRFAPDPQSPGMTTLQLFIVSGPAHLAPQDVHPKWTRFVLEPDGGP